MKDEDAIRLFVRDGGVAREWHAVDQCVRDFYRREAKYKPRPMTGFWATLSKEQQKAALDYRGPENFGPEG